MKFLFFILVIVVFETVLSHSDGMFMCKRVDDDFDLSDQNGWNSRTKPKVQPTRRPQKAPETTRTTSMPTQDDIIKILQERLRLLEMRVILLEKQKDCSVTPSPVADEEMKETVIVYEEITTPSIDTTKPPHHCPIFHHDRCFVIVKMGRGTIGLKDAEKKCKGMKGDLANIYDVDHFAKVEHYLQENMKDVDGKEYFIVGMTYDVEKNTVLLRDGTPTDFTKWYSSYYPNRRSRFNTRIHVQINSAHVEGQNGMYNVSPYSVAKSALCEILPRFMEEN